MQRMARRREEKQRQLTVLPAPNFFSVEMALPLRMAALRADLPRTTVSRSPPPLRTLLPILVTAFQSSDIVLNWRGWRLVCTGVVDSRVKRIIENKMILPSFCTWWKIELVWFALKRCFRDVVLWWKGMETINMTVWWAEIGAPRCR